MAASAPEFPQRAADGQISDAVPAATVALLRDRDGLEVLLLERPSDRGTFRGAWVFPGGRVDPADAHELRADDEQGAARRAAVRETHEETGLALAEQSLVPVARWTPPAGLQRRFRTWFFYALAPQGPVTLNPAESIAHGWMRPAYALERHDAGELTLASPTWVTLHNLARAPDARHALTTARSGEPEYFESQVIAKRTTVVWPGDVAYEAPHRFDERTPRHRLRTGEPPWLYERTPDLSQ